MRKITVESGQSLMDITIQALGNADGLGIICELNGLEYDDDIYPGMSLIVPDVIEGDQVQAYIQSKNIRVNSHIDESVIEVLATNDDEVLVTNNNAAIQL